MTNEIKVSKYERMKTISPIVVNIGSGKTAIALEPQHVKRKADGSEFKNIRVVKGYTGQYGFKTNKNAFNIILDLPLGMSAQEFDNIRDAYLELAKNI